MNYIPKVSVIMSVYNGERHLRETLETVISQTLQDIEIILVCNGATDSTLSIMQDFAQRDARISVYEKEFSEPGGGRNYGIERATGKYFVLWDGDDLFEPEILEKAYYLAEKNSAELIVTSFITLRPDGTEARLNIPVMERIPDKEVFAGHEVRSCFRTLYEATWNKFYLRQFVNDHQLRFPDSLRLEDMHWAVSVIASAERISVLNEPALRYRDSQGEGQSQSQRFAGNAEEAPLIVSYVKEWLQTRGKWEQFEKDYVNFVVAWVLRELRNPQIKSSSVREVFYNSAKKIMQELDVSNKAIEYFDKPQTWFDVQKVLTMSWKEYCAVLAPGVSAKKHTPELIVSMTSYPQRIHIAADRLKEILCQSEKADRVILWLSKEEFPTEESELPEKLLGLKQFGLEIEWCSNLKSYNKLLHALRKYPDAVIVTADDDVSYGTDWLKLLWEAYQKDPSYIYCHRPAMLEIENESFKWTTSGKRFYPQPSYLHRCISHAGILYPSGSLHPDVLNEALLIELAEENDDLWFWIMALRNQTRIAVVDNNIPTPSRVAKHIPGVEIEAISAQNTPKKLKFEEELKHLLYYFPDVRQLLIDEYDRQKSRIDF